MNDPRASIFNGGATPALARGQPVSAGQCHDPVFVEQPVRAKARGLGGDLKKPPAGSVRGGHRFAETIMLLQQTGAG